MADLTRSALEVLEPRRLFAAGDLDTSFGGDGDTSVTLDTGSVNGQSVAVQADGKTVVVGSINAWDGFAVTRYNLNGTPDTTFGPDHNGTVLTPFSSESYASDVAIQSDGKIVVVGTADDTETRIVRYNPDGSRDKTFDGDGIVGFEAGGTFDILRFSHVVIQPDGKILIGGFGPTGIIDRDYDLAFRRFNPDGSADGTFNGGSTKVIGFGENEVLNDMALDLSGTPATNPDFGKLVVAATRYNSDFTRSSVLVTRLTTSGQRDDTYDGDGSGLFSVPENFLTEARGLVIQDDGKIVVGAKLAFFSEATADFVAVRFAHGGPLDTTFGGAGTGWVSTSFGGDDLPSDLIEAPSGALVLAGKSGSQAALAYYTPDGLPDTRFGAGGKRTFPYGGELKLAVGPGRRFVFAGGSGNYAARFLDVGANLVYATTLNQTASESGPTSRGFFLYRVERVPYATRVYFDVGGTATAPYFRARNADYSADGLVFPIPVFGNSDIPYADIPANQTFTVVTLTPVDDALAEGNETASFRIRPDAAYEVGDPGGATFTIVDNDAPPPVVAQVYALGSAWKGTDGDDTNTTFKEYLAAKGLGDADLGYRVDNLAAGSVLPWTNVNQVAVRYSAPPTGSGIPAPGGVTLDGVRSDYSVRGVTQLDPQTFLLMLDRPLGSDGAGGSDGDRIRLTVPSGPPGGTYGLTITVLPGDVNRTGSVVANDFSEVKSRFFRNTNSPATGVNDYSPFQDVDASGGIVATDFSEVKKRFFDTLPPAGASAPDSPVLFSSRRVRPTARPVPESVLS
jgi:uncharacterized delta-60 repeat protein